MDEALRLVIIESAPADGDAAETELRRAGIAFAVRRVETQGAFLEAVADCDPHLILADIRPHAFEEEVLTIVRDTCPDVPLIFIAESSQEATAGEALERGAFDYLLRDQLSRLIPTVRRAMRHRQERAMQRQAEQALLASEERFRAVVEAAADAIISTDPHGNIVLWNCSAETIFGHAAQEMVGKNFDALIPKRFQRAHREGMARVATGGEAKLIGTTVELAGVRKSGSEFPIELSLSTSRTRDGVGFIAIIRDITERKELETLLRSLATMDELTGLHNRRGFLTLAPQYLKLADRRKRAALFVFADLDGLKSINDTFGHQAGDQALCEVARVLKQTFRESDLLGRLGGDEFAVLALDAPVATADTVLARLRETLRAHNAGRAFDLSLSLGIARYDREHRASVEELLAQADAQMYERKREKRIP